MELVVNARPALQLAHCAWRAATGSDAVRDPLPRSCCCLKRFTMPLARLGISGMVAASLLLLLLLTPSAAPPAGHQRARTSFCAARGFRQVWSDEFTGARLNSSNWEKRTMGKVDRMASVEDDDMYLENGNLVLRSQRRAVGGYNFTSGALHTRGKHSWKGRTRVCVRAKLPAGCLGMEHGCAQGVQPAHWMMPETAACWPSNGEIDIMVCH